MSELSTSEPVYPHSILTQESKDMRDKNIEPEIYREVKVTNNGWCVLDLISLQMSCDRIDKLSPQQNHALMKFLSKKCRALGSHSQQGVEKGLHGRDRRSL
jgi:hypothetical protein